MNRSEAGQALDRGLALQDAGRWDAALDEYLRAATLDPLWASAWYNAALIHKWRHEWPKALEYGRRALEVSTPDEDIGSTCWNLGIAATALGEWADARTAWSRLRFPITAGEDGTPSLRCGVTPIRLLGKDRAVEVVWADRFDPVRARILNIPTPETGFRCDDVVLHDAEPVGKRERNGKLCSVFNALELLQRSPLATWAVRVIAPEPADIQALVNLVLREEDMHAEDWTESLELLCKACSEGVPHDHGHQAPTLTPWQSDRRMGFACENRDVVKRVLAAWAQSRAGREVRRISD